MADGAPAAGSVAGRVAQLISDSKSLAVYVSTDTDLVAYLKWMSEPNQADRVRLGVWVLLFLSVFTIIAWRLNAAPDSRPAGAHQGVGSACVRSPRGALI